MTLLMRPEPFTTDFTRLFDSLLGESQERARRWTEKRPAVLAGVRAVVTIAATQIRKPLATSSRQ